jgi:hypothetical protein
MRWVWYLNIIFNSYRSYDCQAIHLNMRTYVNNSLESDIWLISFQYDSRNRNSTSNLDISIFETFAIQNNLLTQSFYIDNHILSDGKNDLWNDDSIINVYFCSIQSRTGSIFYYSTFLLHLIESFLL